MRNYRRTKQIFLWLLFIIIALMMFACAALKNLRTSTEVVLSKPPNYYGRLPREKIASLKVGHLPITTDIRVKEWHNDTIWNTILKDMTDYLDSLGISEPLPDLGLPLSEFPDIYVGSPEMFGAPVTSSSYDSGDKNYIPPMVLYYRNPSLNWKEKMIHLCAERNLDYVLFISVGFSEYMIRQKNWLGQKELVLGTGYRIPVKWLSSLQDPVDVIHVTGALIDKQGKIRRSGAEGILAAKTASLLESAIGLHNALGDEAVSQLTTNVVRKDLPGHPLAYQVALRNLIANLLGREDLLIK